MVIMRKSFIIVLVATMFVACMEDRVNEETNSNVEAEKIYATIADAEGDDTRVELNEKKQTVWTEGDEILTFYSDKLKIWRFNGKTGDRSGSFTYTGSYYDYQNPNIKYDQYYAIYLPDLAITYNDAGEPYFFATLPYEQSYKSHSYGLNTNAMIGTSKDSKNYKFKNIFGYLRLSLTGDKIVKSIEVEGRNGDILAGQVSISTSANVGLYKGHSYTITLDCGEGVQLTDKPTEFYITMLPQTLSKGLSIVVTFTDGTIFTKSTSKSVTISRNTIQPMATIDTGGEVEWQTITIEHTGSKISAPILGGSSALSGNIYWGDGYMSELNTFSWYEYTDSQASHTVTIKSMNATQFYIESCSGVSEIDFSNF